jgi:hypothetical protein
MELITAFYPKTLPSGKLYLVKYVIPKEGNTLKIIKLVVV